MTVEIKAQNLQKNFQQMQFKRYQKKKRKEYIFEAGGDGTNPIDFPLFIRFNEPSYINL